jgi:hypothetical protein
MDTGNSEEIICGKVVSLVCICVYSEDYLRNWYSFCCSEA